MEPSQANVRSIEALERMRTAVIRCLDELKVAMSEAEVEVQKAGSWVTTDRIPHWRNRQQRLAEEVNSARSALFRKETVTSSKDSKPSVVDEKKALARAKDMLEDALERGRRSRIWSVEMPREQAIFKRGIAPLGGMVDRELPSAISCLGRMIEALQRYHRDDLPTLADLIDEGEGVAEPGTRVRRTDEPSPDASAPEASEASGQVVDEEADSP